MEIPKCKQCQEDFNFSTQLPKKLPCSHPLCIKCIKSNPLENTYPVQCPTCNEQSTLDNLESLEIDPISLNLISKKPSECVLHEDQLINHFCTRDKTLVCQKCQEESEHRQHEIQSLSEAVDTYQIQMNLYSRMKRNLVSTLQHNIEQLQEASHNNDMAYQSYKKKLQVSLDEFKAKIDEIHRKSSNEAKVQYEHTKHQINQILQMQSNQLNYLYNIKNFNKIQTENEYNVLQYISSLEHIKNSIAKIHLQLKYQYNFDFKPAIECIQSSLKLSIPYKVKNERLDFQDNYIVSQFPQQCSGDLMKQSCIHDIYFKSYAYIQKSRLITINKDSSLLQQFNLQTKDFTVMPLNIAPTYKNATQIQQVNNDTIIISGISQGEDNRFTVVTGETIKNFKMNVIRGYHRTVTHNFAQFNQFEDESLFDVFILGGCRHDNATNSNVNVAQVEKFNLVNEGEFVQLAPMQVPVFSFGCAIFKNKIYVFGGILVESNDNQLTSKIQVYDIRTNEWTISKTKLPRSSATNSTYLPNQNCLLVYNNTSKAYLDATYLFHPEKEEFVKHGPVFPGAGPVFTANYVDEDKVYQYDNENRLFCYDLNRATWHEVKGQ